MSITGMKTTELTVENVTKELEKVDSAYRETSKRLRALIRVLDAEREGMNSPEAVEAPEAES